MTNEKIALNLGTALGRRRTEFRTVAASQSQSDGFGMAVRLAKLIGFDTAVRALVEISIASGWDSSTQDEFWRAYERADLERIYQPT